MGLCFLIVITVLKILLLLSAKTKGTKIKYREIFVHVFEFEPGDDPAVHQLGGDELRDRAQVVLHGEPALHNGVMKVVGQRLERTVVALIASQFFA